MTLSGKMALSVCFISADDLAMPFLFIEGINLGFMPFLFLPLNIKKLQSRNRNLLPDVFVITVKV